MPNLSVQNRSMGAWQFTLLDGQVQELRVSVYMDVEVEGTAGAYTARVGQDIDFWSLLTVGQRRQLQNIVNTVHEQMAGL